VAATNVVVDVDFFDADGRLVKTESGYLDFLLPGVSTPVIGTVYQPAAAPVRMDARESHDDDRSTAAYGALTIANVTVRQEDYSSSVIGEITSTFEKDQENVQLVAIWKDAAGAVFYTANQYLDRVPSNVPTAFAISLFDESAPTDPPTEVLWAT
jgi:hypothetical protein